MAVGDFYEATIFQTYRGNVMINRYHYEQTIGANNAAAAILTLFQVNVHPVIAVIQSNDVSYNRLLVQNLNNPADNAEDVTPTPSVGGDLNDGVPLFLAMNFKYTRPDLSKRFSYTRLGGVASPYLLSNVFNTASANVVAAANIMAATVSNGTTGIKRVQLRFVYPGGGLPPVITKRYDMTTCFAQSEPTTQDTRKLGRGI